MTHATGKRRGHGEDSIYWDEVGVVCGEQQIAGQREGDSEPGARSLHGGSS